MRVFSIVAENKTIFERLVPDHLMCDLGQAYRFGLGAIGGEDDQSYCAGVLIFDVISGSNGEELLTVAELKWLYVAQEHRKEGAADALMAEFLSVVHAAGIENVMCDLPFSAEYDLLCAYLEAWDFEFHSQNLYELDMSVGDFTKNPIFAANSTRNVQNLSAVDDAAFSQFLKAVQKLPNVLEDLPAQRSYYDCDLSCIYLEAGRPVGGILLRCNAAGELDLLLLRELKKESAILCALLEHSVQAASRKYAPDTIVHIVCRAHFSGSVLERLFPGRQPAIVRRGYCAVDLTAEAVG